MKPMKIVHLSNDFPDAINPAKTHAVKNLLEITSNGLDHLVYSLNRRSPGVAQLAATAARNAFSPSFLIIPAVESGSVVPLCYDAPGHGVYLRSQLERVADWIARDIERRGLRPQIIHAHKLTMEGIVAAQIAARLRIPFAVSIRGDTDTKILAARPDLRSLYRRIFHDAAVAFFFAPWVRRHFERKLGPRTGATRVIPVPTAADNILPPKIVGPRLMTTFHLDSYRRKNAQPLILAAQELNQINGAELSIIGGGSPRTVEKLEAMIARRRSPIRLEGPVPHDAIQDRMNSAGGFVLVSKRESFGMVFIEALLAGCPVVYPTGRAIEGYFDDCPFAIAASPRDRAAITAAMRELATNEASLKSALREWQQGDGPRRFQRAAIAEAYADSMKRAMLVEPTRSLT
jgi:glycosyltransferase involved in cell wall biosynthesis